jgi:metal-sulfur cluster biosynthetic enzyme
MSATMPLPVQRKIDSVLQRVKEPETLRSIGELNLVRRVRYSQSEKRLIVFMDIADPRSTCMVCSLVTEHLRSSIQRELQREMEREFPGFTVEISA